MKRFLTLIIATILISVLASCNRNEVDFDASGSFEAEETIISAETSGTIREFDVEEGEVLTAGKRIGYIDSTQLYLKKKQLEAQINAMLSKRPNMAAQSAALKEQLSTAETEQKRIANLVKSDAATTKQLDDINATIKVIKKQIEAQRSSLSITTEGINKDASVLRVQIAQLNDDLRKCRLVNPVNGTVLTKYAESYEVTSPGKPLYKIADLSTILMRAYVTGNQLPLIKLNQKVNVLTDDGSGGYKQTAGLITWINDKAEFTPKTIQTKDERANMVYAIKIKVTNDGSYKIGMYGEVKF